MSMLSQLFQCFLHLLTTPEAAPLRTGASQALANLAPNDGAAGPTIQAANAFKALMLAKPDMLREDLANISARFPRVHGSFRTKRRRPLRKRALRRKRMPPKLPRSLPRRWPRARPQHTRTLRPRA